MFEAILEKLNQKEEMNFCEEIENGVSAVVILQRALDLMKEEMNHPEDSLSLAMYEYAKNPEMGPIAGWPMQSHTKIEEKEKV